MDHPLLSREGMLGPFQEKKRWGGWVVLQGCCSPDLCQSIEKGVLPGVEEGLFLLLLRSATPEMAWQTCQGLGLWFGASFLEG